MERYLDLSRNYKDVKDQWLVRVRDIKEHPSEEGYIKTQNQQDFYFKNDSVIAVDIKIIKNLKI